MAYTSEIEKLERRWLENPKGRNFAPLADAYRKAGEIDRAIDLCKSGLELHPDYVSAHIVYGRCLIDQKDDPAATEVFQKVLQLDPENILALKILAEIAERTGHYDQGAEWLTRLISADPMNGDAAEALTRMRSKAAQARTAPRPSLPAAEPPVEAAGSAPAGENVAEIVPEKASEDLGIERASSPNVSAELPPRLSLVDMSTVPMEQPDFKLDRASGAVEKIVDADRLVDAEPELPTADAAEAAKDQRMSLGLEAEPELPGQGAVAPRGSMGLEGFDGIDFSNAPASQRMEGMMSDEPASASAENVEVEGLARTQYEGSGMFRLEQPLLESTATPHLEPDGPPVSLPLIMPDDVEPGSAEAPQLAPPPPPLPRASRAAPAPAPAPAPVPASDDADDVSAADTATLSQAEPVLTETMAELYLKQGHKDDALRVYQALLAQRPGDERLQGKVRELDGSEDSPVLTSHPARAPASGLSLGAFLKKILGSRPGAPAAAPLPEQAPLPGPGPRVTSGATPQSMLADAFADDPPPGPPPGSPSRPAADSLSLDAVFGDEGRASAPSVEPPHDEAAAPAPAPAPAAAPKGGFSFDDFFGSGGAPAPAAEPVAAARRPSGSSPRPSTRASRPQTPPVEDAGDLDQFQAWLKGLKS
ncbi:MAG TPA: tetratricopeptide repeat protein [Gemmatimonadales bacterium]|nr:tetratricopeptide repeat protein [Gemmatimonadales bacterium]